MADINPLIERNIELNALEQVAVKWDIIPKGEELTAEALDKYLTQLQNEIRAFTAEIL